MQRAKHQHTHASRASRLDRLLFSAAEAMHIPLQAEILDRKVGLTNPSRLNLSATQICSSLTSCMVAMAE